MSKAESLDPSDEVRPYTVGFSIAVLLILLIAIFHIWRIIFKHIKKIVNSSDSVQNIPVEISVEVPNGDRRVSSAAICIQQLQMHLEYDDEVSEIKFSHQKRPKLERSISESSSKLKGKQPAGRRKTLVARESKNLQLNDVKFFAGYSHRHINDDL